MINIKIVEKNNRISSVEVSGHSGYDTYGQDIVCAGVSTITIAIFNGITEVCKIDKVKISEGDGYLYLEIPSSLPIEQQQKLDILLDTLILAYEQLSNLYPNEIRILR